MRQNLSKSEGSYLSIFSDFDQILTILTFCIENTDKPPAVKPNVESGIWKSRISKIRKSKIRNFKISGIRDSENPGWGG